MTAKEKTIAEKRAKKLLDVIRPNVDLMETAVNLSSFVCDEVMSAVVKNGARWHEYNNIKECLLEM